MSLMNYLIFILCITFLGQDLSIICTLPSYFIQKKMFYSPKKNLQAYIESKNEEILTLKQKILGSRITYEDMQTAKLRLNGLKSSYLQLQREDHLELKEVLKSSHQAINDLIKKKNRLVEDFQHHQKQNQQMVGMQSDLSEKKQKADQFYKEIWTAKQKLVEKKEKKNRQILELEQQITTRRKQLTIEREIGQQLQTARGQLKGKVIKGNKDLAQITQQNRKLRQSIKKQLQEISRLEFQQQNDCLRVENLQLKIEKQEKNCQNLQQKIDASQIFMQRYSQDRLNYLKQSETAINLDTLLKMCTQSNQKKHKQQKQCQQQISYLQKHMQKAFSKRQKLTLSMKIKKQNLKQLKQKGAELKSILNSIFHQDSSVLKLLADKKVYDSQQIGKNTHSQILPNTKQDMLDLMDTSQNFFMKSQFGN